MNKLPFFLPLVAALLLAPACSNNRSQSPCRKAQPTRCCPKANPKPCCPKVKQKPCCPRVGAPSDRTRQHVLKTSPKRGVVTLSNLMDYLPGIPPGYTVL